jgi:hypothetical protein
VQPRAITAIANQANSCLGLVGITGTGKTSLGKTAVEEAWEVYGKLTHWYASDLGGFGNALLSMIRLGICRVWYIRNHTNPFTTMELASQGYWPETMQDSETGLAAPDVRLVPPRQVRWTVICPNDHAVASYNDIAQATAMQLMCPTCGVVTSAANALRMDRVVVRSAGFRRVGHYVYDSMSQMSEWGQIELRGKSARGELPSGSSGGSALGSADAVREQGGAVFGTGSKAQVGFMQDRVPVWLSNIRAIPDQVLPPIVTFGIERSKGDDESGGIPIYGPKIAGNARTSQVPGWLGNCLITAKEPHNPPETDDLGNIKLYHRLWLVNHIDPRDASGTPMVAKHRGEPLGMPDYLEDSGKPEEAWQRCSLRVFYKLLRDQAEAIEARDRARFANAPALAGDSDDGEEILEITAASEQGPAPAPTGRVVKRRVGRAAPLPPMESVTSAVDVAPPNPLEAHVGATIADQLKASLADRMASDTSVADVAPASPIVEQLRASIEERMATTDEVAEALAAFDAKDETTGGNGAGVAERLVADVLSAAPPPVAQTTSRIRRVPRPPAE